MSHVIHAMILGVTNRQDNHQVLGHIVLPLILSTQTAFGFLSSLTALSHPGLWPLLIPRRNEDLFRAPKRHQVVEDW